MGQGLANFYDKNEKHRTQLSNADLGGEMKPLGASGELLGATWRFLGRAWGGLGTVLLRSWGIMGRSCGPKPSKLIGFYKCFVKSRF